MSHDVIVVGAGGMGSAAAAQLAARGRSVLAVEQFTPAHDRGSSHGDSRMVRQAYFEDPAYVPLLLRAYELWRELAVDAPGVLVETGGLMLGRADSATVAGSLRSAQQHGLAHELLDAAELRRRHPQLCPDDETLAVFERRAGFVRPERAVLAHLARAERAGAELHFGEKVLSWSADPSGDGVTVFTDRASYHAGSLVVCGGAWNPALLGDLSLPLTVERQLLFWFQPRTGIDAFRAPQHPVFIWEEADGAQFYSFPALDGPNDGVKVAFFRGGPPAHPDSLDRVVRAGEIDAMRAALARRVPDLAAGGYLRGLACMYTNTPDENFVVGLHPAHPQVAVAAGFSGHGFKFVPVIGEILADLVTRRATAHDIELFDPTRFGVPSADAAAAPAPSASR